MARLPQPGQDDGTWGTILNDFLSQSLKDNGSLKDNSVTSGALAPGSVTTAALATDAVGAAALGDNAVKLANISTTNTPIADQVLSYNGTNLTWATTPAAPVTSVVGQTGVITGTQIAGDAALTSTYGPLPGRIATTDVTAMRPFWTALAKRSTTPVDILLFGDSITEGYKASTFETRWASVLRDTLRTKWQPAGVTGGFGFVPCAYIMPSLPTGSLVTTSGSPTSPTANVYGLGIQRSKVLTTNGQSITLTATCTAVDIFWSGSTGTGQFSYTIDGGSATIVDTLTADAGQGKSGYKTSITGLSAASHVIVVSRSSGSAVIDGFMVYNGDTNLGVRVWEGGCSSTKTASWVASTVWNSIINTIQPDLVIIELGCNDYGQNGTQVSPATMKANLQTLIARIKAQCTTPPSFVLLTTHERLNSASSVVNAWVDYVQAIYQIASEDNTVAIFDTSARIGAGVSTHGGLLDADTIHLSDAGDDLYAQGLAAFLAPR